MSSAASAARRLVRRCVRLGRDDEGATAIEYALIAVGIACAVAAVVFNVGNSLNTNYFGRVNAELAKP